jgi:hypothetical protein
VRLGLTGAEIEDLISAGSLSVVDGRVTSETVETLAAELGRANSQ